MGCCYSSSQRNEAAFQGQPRTFGGGQASPSNEPTREEKRRLAAKGDKKRTNHTKYQGVRAGGGDLVNNRDYQPDSRDLPRNAKLTWTTG